MEINMDAVELYSPNDLPTVLAAGERISRLNSYELMPAGKSVSVATAA